MAKVRRQDMLTEVIWMQEKERSKNNSKEFGPRKELPCLSTVVRE